MIGYVRSTHHSATPTLYKRVIQINIFISPCEYLSEAHLFLYLDSEISLREDVYGRFDDCKSGVLLIIDGAECLGGPKK